MRARLLMLTAIVLAAGACEPPGSDEHIAADLRTGSENAALAAAHACGATARIVARREGGSSLLITQGLSGAANEKAQLDCLDRWLEEHPAMVTNSADGNSR